MINHVILEKTIAHLEAQLQNWRTLDTDLPPLLREAVAESVIKRFEVCYDCLWRALKRHLAEELGVPNLPNSPKPILRIAHENHLLDDIDAWLDYAEARTDMIHDNSGEKPQAVLKRIPSFVADARALYSAMSGEAWNAHKGKMR
jgi:nucleotidyltransferase substrate binding protein (TIGR01987 family)